MPQNTTVPLARALSKLGLLSRSEAVDAIRAGRVGVNGRTVRDPAAQVAPERVHIVIDGEPCKRARWRAILFNKPRGVLTTRRDPAGRPTVYDVLGTTARGLVAVGRLDQATSGLLLLTSDTKLADWITDPENGVPRLYLVTVRGRIDSAALEKLTVGVQAGGSHLKAHAVSVRKASSRESHLSVELREGKNREVRRLFEAIGNEVTRLKRAMLGGLVLGSLKPGEWRELTPAEIRVAFPNASRKLRL